MRLRNDEIRTIRNVIEETFGKSRIFLFGSQLDMSKKGRDIDLYVIPEKKGDLKSTLIAKSRLQRLLHKPVDLVIHRNFERFIEQEGLRGVELTERPETTVS